MPLGFPQVSTPPPSIGGRIIGGTSGSVLFADSSNNFAQNNANLFWDNTNNFLGIGTAAPASKVDIVAGTLLDNAGVALNISATLPAVTTASRNGTFIAIISAGSSAQVQRSMAISLEAGYTGSSPTVCIAARNSAAGTSSSLAGSNGNICLNFNSNATTTGANMGVNGVAQNGDKNAALVGRATTAKNGATNIGAAVFALNTGTTPVQIGGFFGLMNADPTFESGALIADNGTQTSPIFLARDNGTTIFSVFDGGGTVIGTGTTTPGKSRVAISGGTSVATTDWALTSGWGAGASISAVTGNDTRGTVTVTTSVLDTPTLNPVITLTFKDGTWTNTPFPMVCMNDESSGTMGAASCSATVTALKVTYDGTPTALTAATYVFNYHVIG